MIDVRFAASEDLALVNELAELVNRVYDVAEAGLWVEGQTRTSPAVMTDVIRAGRIALARVNGRVVGLVHIQRLDSGEGEFGMLVADPDYRGHGVGGALIGFAERWAVGKGLDTMQLELLAPREWTHPSKEHLKAWYNRLGYRLKRVERLGEGYPELEPLLGTPCDLLVYHKGLRNGG